MLLLVNSVALGTRNKIETVRHAIAMLGRNQIKRWIQLALFANNDDRGMENPLVDMAAVRAGLMENLSGFHHSLQASNDSAEKAYMTGILSILEKVYDIPMEELTRNLNLSEDVRNALTMRQGSLGKLLHLAELLEQDDYRNLATDLDEMRISIDDLLESQKTAYNWRKGMA